MLLVQLKLGPYKGYFSQQFGKGMHINFIFRIVLLYLSLINFFNLI